MSATRDSVGIRLVAGWVGDNDMSSIASSLPVFGPIQAAYFWFKNRKRARLLESWAKEKGLDFASDGGGFSAPSNPARSEDASTLGRHSGKAVEVFSRMIGLSKIQASFPQFASNRLRGDWQSDKNICWGSYKGYTVVVWDTVYYDLNTGQSSVDWTEGEYTSILVLCDAPIHRTLITPHSLGKRLSAFGIEEGRGMFGMSTVQFELDAFNKAYRVKATDDRWTFAIIDQAMMEWLLSQKKHTIELAPGGVTVSTWFTLDTGQIDEQLDFIVGFLDRIPEDLKHSTHSVSGE